MMAVQIVVSRDLPAVAAAGSGQAVFESGGGQAVSLRHAALEALLARDVPGVFELARVHAQVAVGRLEQPLEVVERQRVVHRERADDASRSRS